MIRSWFGIMFVLPQIFGLNTKHLIFYLLYDLVNTSELHTSEDSPADWLCWRRFLCPRLDLSRTRWRRWRRWRRCQKIRQSQTNQKSWQRLAVMERLWGEVTLGKYLSSSLSVDCWLFQATSGEQSCEDDASDDHRPTSVRNAGGAQTGAGYLWAVNQVSHLQREIFL